MDDSIPVPPGTGVMLPAMLQQVSTSTLPKTSSTYHYCFLLLPLVAVEAYVVPISIIVHSGFRYSPLIFIGEP